MGILIDFLAACSTEMPFRLGWKRLRHIRNGHPFEDSVLVDKLRSAKHPRSDDECIYTINIRTCNDCGLTFLDSGLEYIDRRDHRTAIKPAGSAA